MNSCLKKSHLLLIALLISLLGIIINLTSFGNYLEVEFSQDWLFKLRGETQPSKEVIIVSIDKASADQLKLPYDAEKWPRTYYAQALENINQQKPAIIAFNIVFDDNQEPENDIIFSTAIKKANNVILSSYLQQRTVTAEDSSILSSNSYSLESISGPVEILEQSAAGVSPFLLPKISSTVKLFWTYKASAGDIPTFPTTIFQFYTNKYIYPDLLKLIKKNSPIFAGQLPENYESIIYNKNVIAAHEIIRSALINKPQLLKQFDYLIPIAERSDYKIQLLKSWLTFLKGGEILYFNHYGPSGTIPTVSFYKTLMPESIPLNLFTNKIVLIGYAEDLQPEKKQGFYTVFSSYDRKPSSSVEIAATAVSNLIDNSWLKPLSNWEQLLILLVWSLIISSVFSIFSYGHAILATISLSGFYVFLAFNKFTEDQVLLPLTTPLFIQLPTLFVIVSVLTQIKNKKQNQKIQKIFSSYIPDDVVNKITDQTSTYDLISYGELKKGICFATDVGQYTSLSETLNPIALNELMNNYYGIMFPLVKQNSGFVSDVIGDAMLAIWTESEKTSADQTKKNACHTALQIKIAIDDFNLIQSNNLPTRIGMHYGDMYLGNVGSKEHYEYRATGDTINTATRIENLNKILGTHILASSEVIENLTEFISREIGTFVLKGKTRSIIIYELLGYKGETDTNWILLASMFKPALDQFRRYQWDEALLSFLLIQQDYPEDKPTGFYINYIMQHQELYQLLMEKDPVMQQSAVIRIDDIPAIPFAQNIDPLS